MDRADREPDITNPAAWGFEFMTDMRVAVACLVDNTFWDSEDLAICCMTSVMETCCQASSSSVILWQWVILPDPGPPQIPNCRLTTIIIDCPPITKIIGTLGILKFLIIFSVSSSSARVMLLFTGPSSTKIRRSQLKDNQPFYLLELRYHSVGRRWWI